MTADVDDPQALLLSLLDPAVRADPYSVYARLREAGPVVGPMGIVVVSGYADIDRLLRGGEVSSDYRTSAVFRDWLAEQGADVGMWLADDTQPFLLRDPPDHTRLRRLVSKAFTPRAVASLRPRIVELVDGLLDRALARARAGEPVGAADRSPDAAEGSPDAPAAAAEGSPDAAAAAVPSGAIELVDELAYPLPVTVISELLGVPAEDEHQLRGWSRHLARSIDPPFLLSPEDRRASWDAIDEFHEYLRERIAERRAHPRDDLLSALVQARDGGDALTEDELLGTCVLLLAAGHETTVNLIANGTLALLRHPEARAWHAADPEQRSLAVVEETLRHDPPVQLRDRVAASDLDLHGVGIEAGRTLLLLLAAGNRDPRRFPDPEAFAPWRGSHGRGDPGHLGFGAGIHYCLGAPLARLEGEVTFTAIARRLGEARLPDVELVYRPSVALRGLEALPVQPSS
ncbi:cytochrome P450 [Egibacter rhizosphaerae]|uniref:Cytochrome P450 n=1 Tax=Egibacter rhizosphaerae TaxID=1670831 RepID=A0A411YH59_9ACTN|nr:cytochrome P450 [Egibacter rhizosphaerae]QBI20675.1 cytochrome P450 [Egibacter rhizosphaerae]